MNLAKIVFVTALVVISYSCKENKTTDKINLENKAALMPMEHAAKQLTLQLIEAEKANRIPRTIDDDGNMHWVKEGFDWTEGFFSGSLWYLFENTKDEKWRLAAEKFQALFEDHKNYTSYHDLGFIFNCSYGNGYRLTKNEAFKETMITAGDSLMTRFNPTVGCIKSWDVDKGWQSDRNWMFPVIIDNMMNLEMLFELTELTGNQKYKDAAIIHANTTLQNHFRKDNSSYHVVDYNPNTGEVRSKETAQGFADESSWARGQAWGLYGYTVCYRYTKDQKYLEQAQKIADYIINHKDTPSDGIPYWDYNADKIPNEPRDVSAAAITVSALIELDEYSDMEYRSTIDKILSTLASDEYKAKIGENKSFILKHSVGSVPHDSEIDVPLNYADYYYLEALTRYKQ